MKASKQLIVFYKAKVLEPIYKVLKEEGWTKSEVDQQLKRNARIEKSCTEMTMDELGELIRWSFVFGDDLGLDLDFPKDNLDDLIRLDIK